MGKFILNVPYGLAKLSTPEYWFGSGKIHSNSGAVIGYPHRAMTEFEAVKMGVVCGFVLELKVAETI